VSHIVAARKLSGVTFCAETYISAKTTALRYEKARYRFEMRCKKSGVMGMTMVGKGWPKWHSELSHFQQGRFYITCLSSPLRPTFAKNNSNISNFISSIDLFIFLIIPLIEKLSPFMIKLPVVPEPDHHDRTLPGDWYR